MIKTNYSLDKNLSDPLTLMQLAKAGDNDAFGVLYELYYTPVFRYIYGHVRNKDCADDLSQVVFLKIYKSIGNIKFSKGNPIKYFFRVAKNTIIDFWRKKKDFQLDDDEIIYQIPDDRDGMEDIVCKKDFAKNIRAVVCKLSDSYQEVLVLKFFNEWSVSEIADYLKISEAAVCQRQCRALKMLKNYLNEDGCYE